jgi:hypothetical protein
MPKSKFLLIVLAAAALALGVQPASAQANRTWVSGQGDDANPCSRTAPCKTFAGAISKTAAGGEISVLDPGGFGALTITKAITIDGGGGQVASVLVAGTNGIVVQAPATATVTLRNIRINGLIGTPTGGLNGIQFLSGAVLHIENCTIFGFTQNGININLSAASPVGVFVTDTVVSNSVGGIAVRNTSASNVFFSMQRTTLAQNGGFGLKIDGGGGAGAILSAVSDSLISGNGTGVSVVGGPSINTDIQITRSSVANNVTTGLLADGSAGTATILSSETLISGNGTGLSSVGGGKLLTYKNNMVNGNVTGDGAFTGTIVPE